MCKIGVFIAKNKSEHIFICSLINQRLCAKISPFSSNLWRRSRLFLASSFSLLFLYGLISATSKTILASSAILSIGETANFFKRDTFFRICVIGLSSLRSHLHVQFLPAFLWVNRRTSYKHEFGDLCRKMLRLVLFYDKFYSNVRVVFSWLSRDNTENISAIGHLHESHCAGFLSYVSILLT